MTRVWIAYVLLGALAAVPPPVQSQGAAPEPAYSQEDVDIPSWDGTNLRATVYVPKGEGPFPAVLATHGWPGTRRDDYPRIHAERFASDGYVALVFDSRGYGESAGQSTLDGPDEVQDAQHLIAWLAARPDVLRDGDGDPRVGMYGRSYAGGLAQLVAAQDPRVDAVVAETTWRDLYYALIPNGVVKTGWVNLLFVAGETATHGVPLGSTDASQYRPDPTGGATPKLAEWYARAMATRGDDPELRREVGQVRSVNASAIRAPTLFLQGYTDTLFNPLHAQQSFSTLRASGVPSKLVLYPFGHGYYRAWDDPVQEHAEEIVEAWFDRFLRPPGMRPESFGRTVWPVEVYDAGAARFVAEADWPPLRTVPTTYYASGTSDSAATGGTLAPTPPEDGGTVTLVSPGAPAGFTEMMPNFQSQMPRNNSHAPGTIVRFSTPPLDGPVELNGPVHASLNVSGDNAFAIYLRLEDRDAAGSLVALHNQVTPVRVPTCATPGYCPPSPFVAAELPAVRHSFAAGHSIVFSITSTELHHSPNLLSGQVSLRTAAATPSFVVLPLFDASKPSDPQAPTVETLVAPREAPAGAIVGVHVRAADNVGLRDVRVETVPGTAYERATPPAGGSATHGFNLGPLEPGSYQVRIVAEDYAGNVAPSEPWTLEVSSPPTTEGAGDARAQEQEADGIPTASGFWTLSAAVGALFPLGRRRR